MESLLYITISMLTLTGHSLAVNRLFKTEKLLNTSSLLILTVLPSFILSIFYFPAMTYSATWNDVSLMIFKESLYAITLFLRLESFKHLGLFGAGVLLVAQPTLIAVFAWVFLGESLSLIEILLIAITLSGIWIVHGSRPSKVYSFKKIIKYLTLPTVLMSIVAIIDRYLVSGEMSAIDFFVVDKIIILPTFFFIFMFFSKFGYREFDIKFNTISTKNLFNISLIVGSLWGASTFFYGMALELESTIWVAVIRSLSFPLVAVFGSIIDKKSLNRTAYFGLGIVTIGSVLFTIY